MQVRTCFVVYFELPFWAVLSDVSGLMQLVMNVPFTAIHFATYESCKKLLAMEEDESLAVQLAAGGMAGGVSAALTTPLDVVKTRLQLEGVNSATRYSSTAVVRTYLAHVLSPLGA